MARMAYGVCLGRLTPRMLRREEMRTTFMNAAVVAGWEEHVLTNKAHVVEIRVHSLALGHVMVDFKLQCTIQGGQCSLECFYENQVAPCCGLSFANS